MRMILPGEAEQKNSLAPFVSLLQDKKIKIFLVVDEYHVAYSVMHLCLISIT
jgi:hypothetical protein